MANEVRGKPKEKKQSGRPRVYDANKIADDLLEYINSSEDPMIEEFCYNSDFHKDTLYRLAKENTRLSDTIKKCHLKQEILTVRAIENGRINPSFGIFKLKQPRFAWTDKQEVEHSGGLAIKVEWD